jgi:acyl-CoA reductase-like NAD-dependent aldehyde dehydrogenase
MLLQETAMHAARDFAPSDVRPRGGCCINGLRYERRGDIEVRRPADDQPYGQISDAGPKGVDQAVRAAPNALKVQSDFAAHQIILCFRSSARHTKSPEGRSSAKRADGPP